MNRDEVFGQIQKIMIEMFELEPSAVTLEAKVFEDLDLDSIDAIDLVARLQQIIGERVDESRLKDIRTVADVVSLVVDQVEAVAASGGDVDAILANASAKDELAG